MYNGQIIKELLKKRGLLVKDLLEYLYTDPNKRNGSIKQLETGNPTVKTLEKIADFFQVSMDVFFERPQYSPKNTEAEIKIEGLERLLEEKDKRIEELKLFNQLLTNKISE